MTIFQKWSNYSNLLELYDQHSVYIQFIFSLFQKWSNYSNLLEWYERYSVYFRSGQIILTYWNYMTDIQFISKTVKLF